jgi:hypothetical protein
MLLRTFEACGAWQNTVRDIALVVCPSDCQILCLPLLGVADSQPLGVGSNRRAAAHLRSIPAIHFGMQRLEIYYDACASRDRGIFPSLFYFFRIVLHETLAGRRDDDQVSLDHKSETAKLV